MKIDEKLALDAFKNDKESHIIINHPICRSKSVPFVPASSSVPPTFTP